MPIQNLYMLHIALPLFYYHGIMDMDALLNWDAVVMTTLIYEIINVLYLEMINAVDIACERIVIYLFISQCQRPECVHSLSHTNLLLLHCEMGYFQFVIIAIQSEFSSQGDHQI